MKAKDLKNSILQMAVEGKLVPQDPSDEPATVLLERIREEKHRLIAEGKAKFPKGGESIIYTVSDGSPYEKRVDAKGHVLSDTCIADEAPLEELPKGWAWVRLSTLFTKMGSGSTPAGGRKVYQDEGPLLIRSQNVHNEGLKLEDVAHFAYSLFKKRGSHVLPNDILLNITGASIGRCAIVPNPFEEADVNQHVLIMRPVDSTLNHYLHIAIVSPLIQAAIMVGQVGATKEGLSATKASNLIVPVPPLAEQYRVVERVNQLMPLVEEYGKLEDDREALDAALPERLRKSVLQVAVQGKLVPQDPSNEPASTLLERIRGQRRQIIAEKKMKAPKGGESVIFRGSDGRRYEKRVDAKGRESEPACIEDEVPFEIPEGWEWARLESVTMYIQRGKSPRYSTVKKHPVVAQKCNQWSGFSLEKAKFIDPETVCKYGNERILRDGDLLWNSTGLGTLGRMAIYDSSKNEYGWAVADSHVTVIRTREDWLNYRFAFAYFAGPSVQSVIENQASGSTKQKELAQETVKNYLIPIPPLAEQCRIVTQLEAVLSQITNQ